jgi:hypothetical protein
MAGPALMALPLPVFSALLCGVLAVLVRRLDLGNPRAPVFLSALFVRFVLFAAEASLVARRFGYGLEGLIVVQRVLPLFAGPLMYLGFSALALPEERFRATAFRHLGAALAVAVGLQLFTPRSVAQDAAISARYFVYAGLLVFLWRKGPDALTDFAERAQVARYGAEQAAHFDWHSDIGAGALAARRKLTMVVQLSDPASYAGGVLEVWPDGHVREALRSRGTAAVFPSFLLHRVTPVTAGERWSLTIWAHGPAFR